MTAEKVEQNKRFFHRSFSVHTVQNNYARVAGYYDIWSWLTESKATKTALDLANIEDGETVLEVAVGTGIAFEKITGLNKHGNNVGLDLSPAMLAKARGRLAALNSIQAHLQIADAFHLPFKSGKFDLVINQFMFDLLPEEEFPTILNEFRRVLTDSGRVVIANMAHGEEWFHRFWLWLAKQFPKLLTGCRPVSLGSYLTAAGFSNVQVVHVSQNTFPSEVLRAES
ncbi:methyltransferase domain-containing protein [candidate division KSB1 bacterium]|nr:methyltransferase domain-containing protein [candidate division KSB1 bacterium]NIR72764.1 methyltransferase domain-containing protein [candidate division KSB1 bacterium]NIS23720.1 methyltransferase domain-containing protein [candidate division KSB1 bacterium]NIT70640.1 methyltransferase domain-containing protein [candidate division KSB1 bacterium]NIU24368.1 methyltransferase domain-containing protein [candidate division KSB1 bacterium]